MQTLWKPWLIRAEPDVSQRQARDGPLPFKVSVYPRKSKCGLASYPGFVSKISTAPDLMQSHACINSHNLPRDQGLIPHDKALPATPPSPNTVPHHASEGWVRGAEGLQTLRRECEKALYWGVQQGGARPSPPTCPHPLLGPWGERESPPPRTGPPLSLVQ